MPSPKLQLKKKGGVPPKAVAVNVTAEPTVLEDGPMIITNWGQPATVTAWLTLVRKIFLSVTFNVTVKVPRTE